MLTTGLSGSFYSRTRFITCVIILLVSGCSAGIEPTVFNWVAYENQNLGYRLKVPNAYAITQSGDFYVRFSYGFRSPVIIRYTDESEAANKGLWFGTSPVEPGSLGGIEGQIYAYTHYDGPVGARMVSYVVPYRGKYLALEFRTDGAPDDIQKQVLASFTFTQ